jgi:Flp pilus assembly protein TadG
MAFIIIPFSLFLFGIITFGLVMSFKQNMVQAASEGARAGAVAANSTDAVNDATLAVKDAVQGFGKTCGVSGLTCVTPTVTSCPTLTGKSCITVTVQYDYKHYPFIGVPLVGQFIPNTISATSSSVVNS